MLFSIGSKVDQSRELSWNPTNLPLQIGINALTDEGCGLTLPGRKRFLTTALCLAS